MLTMPQPRPATHSPIRRPSPRPDGEGEGAAPPSTPDRRFSKPARAVTRSQDQAARQVSVLLNAELQLMAVSGAGRHVLRLTVPLQSQGVAAGNAETSHRHTSLDMFL